MSVLQPSAPLAPIRLPSRAPRNLIFPKPPAPVLPPIAIQLDVQPGLKQIFKEQQYSDCEVVITRGGEEIEEFPCHRHVLAHHSGFFRGAFASDMIESSGRICLPELPILDTRNVSDILKLMYYGKIEVGGADRSRLADLISAASFLEAPHVLHTLMDTTFNSKENVAAVLARLTRDSEVDESDQLFQGCLMFFQRSPDNCRLFVERPDLIRECSPSFMRFLLGSEKLPMSEGDILRAAVAWASAQVGRADSMQTSVSEVFGPLAECVRWETLSFAQLQECAYKHRLLPTQRLLELFKNVKATENTTWRYLPPDYPTWDLKAKKATVKLSNNNLTASSEAESSCAVMCGSQVLTQGKHYWEIRIDKVTQNGSASVTFGVLSSKTERYNDYLGNFEGSFSVSMPSGWPGGVGATGGVYCDMDKKMMWGVWGDKVSDAKGFVADSVRPAISAWYAGNILTANFTAQINQKALDQIKKQK